MTFRNRYMVAGANGVIPLSVPIVHGRNQKTPIRDVRICYREKWQKVHWVTITSCYNRSPFFEYYRDGISHFFTGRWEFLFDWNLEVINWLNAAIGYKGSLEIWEGDAFQGTDLRDQFVPGNYMQATGCPVYPQVFQERYGFQPNLSILDLLCNTGPETKNFLL